MLSSILFLGSIYYFRIQTCGCKTFHFCFSCFAGSKTNCGSICAFFLFFECLCFGIMSETYIAFPTRYRLLRWTIISVFYFSSEQRVDLFVFTLPQIRAVHRRIWVATVRRQQVSLVTRRAKFPWYSVARSPHGKASRDVLTVKTSREVSMIKRRSKFRWWTVARTSHDKPSRELPMVNRRANFPWQTGARTPHG